MQLMGGKKAWPLAYSLYCCSSRRHHRHPHRHPHHHHHHPTSSLPCTTPIGISRQNAKNVFTTKATRRRVLLIAAVAFAVVLMPLCFCFAFAAAALNGSAAL